MKIGSIGYNYSHDSSFLMDRPNGVGSGLMLFIKTPAIFTIDGRVNEVRENSFVIFTENVPCSYRAARDIYTDDWLYFTPDSETMAQIAALKIPVNQVVYIGDIEELSRIMHILSYEHYSAEPFHEQVEERYIDILLFKLSRIIQLRSAPSPDLFIERNDRLTRLRARIYTMPESVSDIDTLADEMGMSRSGFQHLYKKLFGVSVMTDVINGRIDRAKRLLVGTNLTVREIAERCGYSGEYNFMRQFKRLCGKTPTEYRNSDR